VVPDQVETVAHLIQIALTPVFLFSGVATLLNVLSTRLGRVADRVDALTDKYESADAQGRRHVEARLTVLRRRSLMLDVAVILAALAGMSTLVSAGLLFVDSLRDRAGAALFVAFGVSLLLVIGALAAYLAEMMLASVGLRHEARGADERDEPTEAPEAPEGDAAAPEAASSD
jgi:hypothetical protein